MTHTTPHTFDDEIRVPGVYSADYAGMMAAQAAAGDHDLTGTQHLGICSLGGVEYTRYRVNTPVPAPAPAPVDTYRHDAHCTGRYDCHCRACE
ncbi:MAG: hypothetical protein F4Y14_22135 [Acidobacteria bacterium]|nr:hypothetical protein [Acidobacteriota bacterium]